MDLVIKHRKVPIEPTFKYAMHYCSRNLASLDKLKRTVENRMPAVINVYETMSRELCQGFDTSFPYTIHFPRDLSLSSGWSKWADCDTKELQSSPS
jgi:hypothetical protein